MPDPAARLEKIPTVVVDSHEALSRTIARRIAAVLAERRAAGARPVLGLATGSTPIGVYRELIRMHREDGLSFRGVVTFNLDEYHPMPPKSIHSYRRFMQENLFDHIDIAPADTHVPDGTVPRDAVGAMAESYEAAIHAAGGIDFQLLGI